MTREEIEKVFNSLGLLSKEEINRLWTLSRLEKIGQARVDEVIEVLYGENTCQMKRK
jgi:hypothetical protein